MLIWLCFEAKLSKSEILVTKIEIIKTEVNIKEKLPSFLYIIYNCF